MTLVDFVVAVQFCFSGAILVGLWLTRKSYAEAVEAKRIKRK